MVLLYHAQVEWGLFELCKTHPKIKHVFKGNKEPLSLVDAFTKSVVNYKPDIYAITKNNKKIIFEVLESEAKKQDIIIADLLRSCFVENVKKIIFILSPDDYKDIETVVETFYVVHKYLKKLGVINDLPDCCIYAIPRDCANNNKKLLRTLKKYSKEDKW